MSPAVLPALQTPSSQPDLSESFSKCKEAKTWWNLSLQTVIFPERMLGWFFFFASGLPLFKTGDTNSDRWGELISFWALAHQCVVYIPLTFRSPSQGFVCFSTAAKHCPDGLNVTSLWVFYFLVCALFCPSFQANVSKTIFGPLLHFPSLLSIKLGESHSSVQETSSITPIVLDWKEEKNSHLQMTLFMPPQGSSPRV